MSVPTTAASGKCSSGEGGKAALRLIGSVASVYQNVNFGGAYAARGSITQDGTQRQRAWAIWARHRVLACSSCLLVGALSVAHVRRLRRQGCRLYDFSSQEFGIDPRCAEGFSEYGEDCILNWPGRSSRAISCAHECLCYPGMLRRNAFFCGSPSEQR